MVLSAKKNRFINPSILLLFTCLLFSTRSNGQTRALECPVIWEDFDYNNCLGENSFAIADLDNDGDNEMIFTGDYPNRREWYVTDYNPFTQRYEIIFRAQFEGSIINHRLFIDNVDDDENLEIMVTDQQGGRLLIYDGATLTIQEELNLVNRHAEIIAYADLDGDGVREFIGIDGGQEIILLDRYDFSQVREYSYSRQRDCLVKDVDSDGTIEIVTDYGDVLSISNDELIVEWQVDPSTTSSLGRKMQLADIDQNGQDELYFTKDNRLEIFPLFSNAPYSEINETYDVKAFFFYDVNDDSILDIIYSLNDINLLRARNLSDQSLLWELPISAQAANLAIADIDLDSSLEFIITQGCSVSLQSDDLLVLDYPSFAEEFKSTDRSAFFSEASTADLDQDGNLELLTLSFTSEGGGNGGVISAFDYETQNLLWQTLPNLIGEAHDLEIVNFDDDPALEMIVAGKNSNFHPAIWVIDGATLMVEHVAFFPNLDSGERFFSRTSIADIDQDGELDIIAGSGEKIYRLDTDLNIINSWTDGEDYSSLYLSWEIGNADDDPELEIIWARNSLFILDPDFSLVTAHPADNFGYSAVALRDVDGDDRIDYILGHTDGHLEVRKSENFDILLYVPEPENSQSILEVLPLNTPGDGSVDLFFRTGGYVRAYIGEQFFEQEYDGLYYGTDHLKLLPSFSFPTDSMLALAANGVEAFSAHCLSCSPLSLELIAEAACQLNDNGQILSNVEYGATPYTYQWNTGDDSANLLNILPGTYHLTLTDDANCERIDTVTLTSSTLAINPSIFNNLGCVDNPTAEIYLGAISGASFPINYSWNTGLSTNIPILSTNTAGVYIVTITDAANCTLLDTFLLQPDGYELELNVQPDDPFTSNNDGLAILTINGGLGNFSYLWNDPLQQTGNAAIQLANGIYFVEVTDEDTGCLFSVQVIVDHLVNTTTEAAQEEAWLVYPNPASQKITVSKSSFGHTNEQHLLIRNSHGQIVVRYDLPLNTLNFQIDCQSFPAGVYYLFFQSDERTAPPQKLVIIHE